MKRREYTWDEMLAIARFLRDTPFLSLVRQIVKIRWLGWCDKRLDADGARE